LPERPERHHGFATEADAQLIAAALNAYRPPPPQQPEARPTESPGQGKTPKRQGPEPTHCRQKLAEASRRAPPSPGKEKPKP
jgi:hypothetical protein